MVFKKEIINYKSKWLIYIIKKIFLYLVLKEKENNYLYSKDYKNKYNICPKKKCNQILLFL